MDNIQLSSILSQIPEFRGVYTIDTIPLHVREYPSAFVVNTDTSKGPAGEHWLVLYFDRYGNGEFFDSYAQPPEMYGMLNFLARNSIKRKYVRNEK
jgi:hypothetical protein